jgi:hypothetical protein
MPSSFLRVLLYLVLDELVAVVDGAADDRIDRGLLGLRVTHQLDDQLVDDLAALLRVLLELELGEELLHLAVVVLQQLDDVGHGWLLTTDRRRTPGMSRRFRFSSLGARDPRPVIAT